jgi:hypothetical protein
MCVPLAGGTLPGQQPNEDQRHQRQRNRRRHDDADRISRRGISAEPRNRHPDQQQQCRRPHDERIRPGPVVWPTGGFHRELYT